MRSTCGPFLTALLLTFWFGASLASQSLLSTSYAGNHHLVSLDGGVYFDLTVHHELHLDQIDCNLLSPVGTVGAIDVFVRPGSWVDHTGSVGDWVFAGSGAVVAAGPQQASACALSTPIGLPPGTYGIALHHRAVMPVYMFAFGPRTFGNADLALVGGGSSLRFLEGAPFFYRVFSGALHYTLGGGPYQVATVLPFGEGCTQRTRSFYELFYPGDIDLSGRQLRLRPNAAGGYDVENSVAAPIVLPTGAQNLGLQRGGAAFVTLPQSLPFPGGSTPSLLVLASGRVLLTDLGLLGGTAAGPSPQTLLAGLPTVAAAWMDLVPSGADNVYAHVDPASGTTTVVWWHVPLFGAPVGTGNTFAFVAHVDGTIELQYGVVGNPNDACLVGFGAGFAARDPGPRDLSLVGSFATQSDDPGLGLAASGRPVLGQVTTLRLTAVPSTAVASVLLLGWQGLAPGLDLGALGAPGCQLYVDSAAAAGFWLGSAATLQVPMPGVAAMFGIQFHAQGAVLVPAANALGLLTSNALVLSAGSV